MTMAPVPYRVAGRREETPDTTTLVLEPCKEPIAGIRPGQSTMLYALGVGEVPVSVSRTGRVFEQTIRDVGALVRAALGQTLGVRVPYGIGWGWRRRASRPSPGDVSRPVRDLRPLPRTAVGSDRGVEGPIDWRQP